MDVAGLRSQPEGRRTAPLFSSLVPFRDGRERVCGADLFNHGTHHRGQLTTLIRQAGRDPGVTDLPWLPGVVRIADAES